MPSQSGGTGRLVILSGPSCVGKSPLGRALQRIHPGRAALLQPLVLYNSRSPRPGERDGVDYHFRERAFIDDLRNRPGHAVFEVRGDLQALDLDELQGRLRAGADLFFEGNPWVGSALLDLSGLACTVLSAFMSPLSREEILALSAGAGPRRDAIIVDVMRRKLLRRTRRQKGELALPDLENIERRAGAAPVELALAHRFGCVIPNHDGEDSENWDAFYWPLGDARRALAAFVAMLDGDPGPAGSERWEASLFDGD